MICLFDNDIISKLAFCDLFDDALTTLGAKRDEVFVLPTARFVLLKPIKHPEVAKERLGEAAYDRVRTFLESVGVLDTPPPTEEFQIFDDLVGIDSGEAILFSATAQFPQFVLATGDKRSLRALYAEPKCKLICDRLAGKVVCFEQVVRLIIDQVDFASVLKKLVPARGCDTALRAVFGSGLDATERNVKDGLASYIAELRNLTGGLLMA